MNIFTFQARCELIFKCLVIPNDCHNLYGMISNSRLLFACFCHDLSGRFKIYWISLQPSHQHQSTFLDEPLLLYQLWRGYWMKSLTCFISAILSEATGWVQHLEGHNKNITLREGFKKKIKNNYGKFHIGSWPPPPPPCYGKFFFIFFSETRPFFENFL